MTAGRVVVVGAGLGGLAAAIRLAATSLPVTLLERGSTPGGRAGRIVRDGYAFDTGPTVLTMPSLLEELFALAGERMSDRLRIVRLDPAYRAVFHDGSVVCVRAGLDALAAEVREVCGASEADRLRRLARHLHQLYEAEYGDFIDRNFDSAVDLVRRPAPLLRLARLGGFRRMHALVASFLQDWRLIRLFTFQAMYAGMSPFEALGIYAIIPYMDTIAGVYFPQGGIHAVSQALADLAVRLGVDLRMGEPVESVEVADGRARAVRTAGGQRIACDVVVLNPDLPVAYRDLLPPGSMPRRVERLRYSPSCVVVHLGLDQRLHGAAHHNIHFARGYEDSFADLLAGRMQRDPSWFLTVPTCSDPGMAPPGGEVAFQLLPVPNLHRDDRIDWDGRAEQERAEAAKRMEGAGYGPVREVTVTSEVVTPADWARMGMAAGTPFAASHHFSQTGPFRPANVAPKVGGVVFAGSGTTPGVGVPMVLISGKLAAERVLTMLR
ncbi:MAG: phytoene desaturase family protein [Egibacteraceae bacterium]